MKEVINKFRFWLARMIGGPTINRLGSLVSSATLSVITATLRPTAIPVPKDAPYSHDKLNREDFGTGLCKLLTYGDNTGTIILDGAWGTGKTTFLKMLAGQLQNHVEGSERMVVIEMNAWENDAFREPIEYISEKIREGLKNHKKTLLPKRWQQWLLYIPWIVDFLLKLSDISFLPLKFAPGFHEALVTLQAFHAMVKLLSRMGESKNYHARILEDLKNELQEEAIKLWNSKVHEGPRRILVIIDELDRCRPDYAIRFLETMKHVFEVSHVTFLLAVDKSQLIHSIKGVYGSNFDAEKYLERFGDVWLSLPENPRSDFIAGVLEKISFENYLPKGTNNDDALEGITANDMMVAVLDRADKNLREIEKIANEICAILCLAREQIKDCAIGMIALALTRHIVPDTYKAFNNPHTAIDPQKVLAEIIGNSSNIDDPALTLVSDMLHCLQADVRGSDLPTANKEEIRRYMRRHLANYKSSRSAIELYESAM